MGTIKTNQFKNGTKFMQDSAPCNMISLEIVNPGKGQAFTRVKFKNLLTGRVIERTFKSGEAVEEADVMETDYQYLYQDEDSFHFMHPETFEQVAMDKETVGDTANWLKEEDTVTLILWNENPINVSPSNFVELEVVETDPGLKGDTAQGGSKPATLSTGAVVRVPLFIEVGEKLKIDTRTGEYASRA